MGNFAVIKTYRNTVLTVYPKYSHKYDNNSLALDTQLLLF